MTEENQPSTEDVVKENIKSPAIWKRLLYMLLFMIVWGIAEFVLFWVVVFQFIYSFSGKQNENLQRFGRSMAVFMADIVQFLTYNTEEHPFPLSDWPEPGEPSKRRRTPKRPASPRRKTSATKNTTSSSKKKTSTSKSSSEGDAGDSGDGKAGS